MLFTGSSLECCSENPSRNHLPTLETLLVWRAKTGGKKLEVIMISTLTNHVRAISVLKHQPRLCLGWLVAFAICLGLASQARADQFDTMRTFWTNYLVAQGGTPQSTVYTGSASGLASTANSDLSSMATNTTTPSLWSSYPLGPTANSTYLTSTFQRLELMAEAWANPACSTHGNAALGAAVVGGLDWMVANVYKVGTQEPSSANWWDWEMGGAGGLANAVALMYPLLTATEITNYCAALDWYEPGGGGSRYGWQNDTAVADFGIIMVARGFVGKDGKVLTAVQQELSNYNTFAYTTAQDGVYVDGSYVMHTCFAYTGGYGVELLADTSEFINVLSNSTWQLPYAYQTNVFGWVSNAWEPVIYGGSIMDMTRGRYLSRSGETENGDGSAALKAIQAIAAFAPPATALSFSNFAASPLLPPGQFQFACMDRVVALRSGFGLGVSMSSTRIANYESINGENTAGWFTGDGMTYLYLGTGQDSQFVNNFWPTVDMHHLPGTTVELTNFAAAQGEAGRTSQNWAGGAQVLKKYGAAGMSLANPLTPSLTAKKSWFMFDNEVVCLGAGVTCGDTNEIDTTVEDRRLVNSPTNKLTVNGTAYSPVMGWSNSFSGVSWCALDGVAGYYFPGGATNLKAQFVANTGSWANIGGSGGSYTDDYLKLWFNHGGKPSNATYSYVLLPNMNAASVSNYALNPDIVVLTNTSTLQAAQKPLLGVVAANFWTAGTRSVDLITVNKPSSVITSENALGLAVGVSDPTQTNTGSITLTLNRAASALVSADSGVTVSQLSPQIILSVNVKNSLGKTFQAAFSYPSPSLTWDASTGTPGAQDGAGSWQLTSTNWWIGNADVAWSNATPYGAIFGTGGTPGTVTISFAPVVTALTFAPVASGSYTLAGSGSGSLTISNGINANATAALTVPVNLASNQIWTVASGQTLSVGGTVSASPPVSLSLAGPGAVLVNGSGTIGSGPVAVLPGATLAGTGTINGALEIAGTVSPGTGASVGTLSTGGQTWDSGGSYLFSLNSATSSSGWNLLNVGGAIYIQSSSGSPFTIKLVSLTSGNTPGPVPGFASNSNSTWTVATSSGGIQNLSPGSVVVDTTAFSNTFTGAFSVTTDVTGNSLLVQYTPPLVLPPAPVFNTWGMAGGQIAFTFSGTNGQTFQLLASPDLALPLSNWTVLTNGTFGATPVNFTDAATNAQEYYQLESP